MAARILSFVIIPILDKYANHFRNFSRKKQICGGKWKILGDCDAAEPLRFQQLSNPHFTETSPHENAGHISASGASWLVICIILLSLEKPNQRTFSALAQSFEASRSPAPMSGHLHGSYRVPDPPHNLRTPWISTELKAAADPGGK